MGPVGHNFSTLENFHPQECEEVKSNIFREDCSCQLMSFYNIIMSAVTFCATCKQARH